MMLVRPRMIPNRASLISQSISRPATPSRPGRRSRAETYVLKTASMAAWSLRPSSRHRVRYSQVVVFSPADAKM